QVLEDVIASARQFDMTAWVKPSELDTCGTACCALGYAALDPCLHAEGLSMIFSSGYGDIRRVRVVESVAEYNAELAKATIAGDIRHIAAYPVFGNDEGFDAAVYFYDITKRAAKYLFDPDFYRAKGETITPQEVIERVREVIALDGDA